MRELWLSAVMLAGVMGLWLAGGTHREAPLVGHQKLGAEVAFLEASVAQNPHDAAELEALCRAYLKTGAAGLALAALHRAPTDVQQQPSVSHLWAQTLLHEGLASQALEKERATLHTCSSHTCPPWILASAMRHESFLQAMVAQGIEDYRADPAGTIRAYERMNTRTVAVLDRDSFPR